jgi:hypothetical protein
MNDDAVLSIISMLLNTIVVGFIFRAFVGGPLSTGMFDLLLQENENHSSCVI